MKTSITGLALSSLSLLACSDSGAEPGTLEVKIYGEELAEEGIPADVFHDGWTISFDKVLVSLGTVTAAAGEGDPALEAPAFKVWDLAQASAGEGYLVAADEVDGGDYDHVGFRVAPDADATAGNASADDVALVVDGGYSLYVAGSAEKDGDVKTFAWGFDTATAYGHCAGTAAVDGNDAATVVTIHMDHLFYDDLFSPEPNVAFELVAAADADGDGTVADAELGALDLSAEERYQVGSTGVDNLWDFIAYQTGTVGHIDGEGHCEEAVRE